MEREQVVSEVRRQAEAEKEIAIAETKKKKWVSLFDYSLSPPPALFSLSYPCSVATA